MVIQDADSNPDASQGYEYLIGDLTNNGHAVVAPNLSSSHSQKFEDAVIEIIHLMASAKVDIESNALEKLDFTRIGFIAQGFGIFAKTVEKVESKFLFVIPTMEAS